MEKYILNETPSRTSVNYGINDITIEMDIPEIKLFDNAMIITEDLEKIQIKTDNEIDTKKKINSKLGLDVVKNYKTDIVISENIKISTPIIIEYNFNEDNNVLIQEMNIILKNNAKADIIIKFNSEDQKEEYFNYLKQNVTLEENAIANITIENMINKNSYSFIAIENEIKDNAQVEHILLELEGKNKISNYNSNLNGENSINNIKNIYLGTSNDVVDINYNMEVKGKNAKCNIESEGALSGCAKKNFKGTINFNEGCTNSIGKENENCIILSDKAQSKSLPMLLCHEENVEGEHGVSSGKLDESKLFYIMTKGISRKNAEKLIVKAKFNKIIEHVKDPKIKEDINFIINKL